MSQSGRLARQVADGRQPTSHRTLPHSGGPTQKLLYFKKENPQLRVLKPQDKGI